MLKTSENEITTPESQLHSKYIENRIHRGVLNIKRTKKRFWKIVKLMDEFSVKFSSTRVLTHNYTVEYLFIYWYILVTL